MTNIVKRLRNNHPVGTKPDPLLFEAADEIERLHSEKVLEKDIKKTVESVFDILRESCKKDGLDKRMLDVAELGLIYRLLNLHGIS